MKYVPTPSLQALNHNISFNPASPTNHLSPVPHFTDQQYIQLVIQCQMFANIMTNQVILKKQPSQTSELYDRQQQQQQQPTQELSSSFASFFSSSSSSSSSADHSSFILKNPANADATTSQLSALQTSPKELISQLVQAFHGFDKKNESNMNVSSEMQKFMTQLVLASPSPGHILVSD
jgi:hypothetical protein